MVHNLQTLLLLCLLDNYNVVCLDIFSLGHILLGKCCSVCPLKANSHVTHHAHAVPLPCHATLIHTCHAVPLPLSDSAVSFVKVR
jgi:hypothetical protein